MRRAQALVDLAEVARLSLPEATSEAGADSSNTSAAPAPLPLNWHLDALGNGALICVLDAMGSMQQLVCGRVGGEGGAAPVVPEGTIEG